MAFYRNAFFGITGCPVQEVGCGGAGKSSQLACRPPARGPRPPLPTPCVCVVGGGCSVRIESLAEMDLSLSSLPLPRAMSNRQVAEAATKLVLAQHFLNPNEEEEDEERVGKSVKHCIGKLKKTEYGRSTVGEGSSSGGDWHSFFFSDVRNFSRPKKKVRKNGLTGERRKHTWRERTCTTCKQLLETLSYPTLLEGKSSQRDSVITRRFRRVPPKLRQTILGIVEGELENADDFDKVDKENQTRAEEEWRGIQRETLALATAEVVVHEWMDYCVSFRSRRVVDPQRAVHFSEHRLAYPHLYTPYVVTGPPICAAAAADPFY